MTVKEMTGKSQDQSELLLSTLPLFAQGLLASTLTIRSLRAREGRSRHPLPQQKGEITEGNNWQPAFCIAPWPKEHINTLPRHH